MNKLMHKLCLAFLLSFLFAATSQAQGTKQCFGDGVDNICPCGNDNDSSGVRGNEAGCANGSNSGGCNLTGFNTDSVSIDDLTLCFDGAPPNVAGLLFVGINRISFPFGDGIRCCGGQVRRIELIIADATGAGCSTDPLAFETGAVAGDSSCFQFWYRDPGSICGSGYNLSNGYKVVWTP